LEVAAASSEQASGVAQMNRAMSQLDQVTQRNAAAAEELSSTAEEMNSQAGTLHDAISFFTVAEADDAPPAPVPVRHFKQVQTAHAPAAARAHVSRESLQPPLPVGDAADYKRF
jgi:methyl-accepting chemotaxis protein